MVPFEHTTFYSCHCKYSVCHCRDKATNTGQKARYPLYLTPALGGPRLVRKNERKTVYTVLIDSHTAFHEAYLLIPFLISLLILVSSDSVMHIASASLISLCEYYKTLLNCLLYRFCGEK